MSLGPLLESLAFSMLQTRKKETQKLSHYSLPCVPGETDRDVQLLRQLQYWWHTHPEQTRLQLLPPCVQTMYARTKALTMSEKAAKTQSGTTQTRSPRAEVPPCCAVRAPEPTLSNFIISGLKWACNFHFFMGLSNLLQMAAAGHNAFLPRKLFFLFSSFLVEDLPGWVTVLH